MAVRPLSGYPNAIGGKWESIVDHPGPSSYTQVATGTPPTGGDTVTAAEFGLKYIESISAELSDNGQYTVLAFNGSGSQPLTSAVLQWTVATTGAQVTGSTNLSARTVRLRAVGW